MIFKKIPSLWYRLGMKFLKIRFKILVYVFAVIGFSFVSVYLAVKFHLTNTSGIIDQQSEAFRASGATSQPVWALDPEWKIFSNAITKDYVMIDDISQKTGVPARLIMTQVAVEQLRFYHTDRASFKKFFEPLKILGSQTQFSWGISGIKEETALQIETHLKDSSSPYYLGPKFETMLDFKTDNPTEERFTRITDQHNHYYAYLYTALYLKQIMSEWKQAGYDISNRPDILTTLFNIGFIHSKPKPNPASGGAEITVNTTVYSFGALGGEIYNSNELLQYFPKNL